MNRKNFALIGYPLVHTISPLIHKKLFALSGIDANYKLIEIPKGTLSDHIETLKKLDGYNVTIPHKQDIIPWTNKQSIESILYKSINTVKNNYGVVEGHNTDGIGFLKSLKKFGISLDGRVVILGCGGVARTISYEAALNNCEVTIAVRQQSLDKANILKSEIMKNLKNTKINTCLINEIEGAIDLLINCTPVGMYPNICEMPINDDILKKCKYVYDTIYNPLDTFLVKQARLNGLKSVGGLWMLILQAVGSHKIWTGSEFSNKDIEVIYDETFKYLKELEIHRNES